MAAEHLPCIYCLLCMVDYVKRKNKILFSLNDVILMFFRHLLASLVLSELNEHF